jgi:hypothetical protein
MNPLFILLGAAAVGSMFGGGTPGEVNNIKKQMPKEEQEAFLKQYKSLSGKDKTDFKTALKNADMSAASQIIGQDLTKYNVAAAASTEGNNLGDVTAMVQKSEQPTLYATNDFADRINKILAVPTSIDPALVAEAAKKYESVVPSGSSASITEKTKKLIETQA